MWCCSAAFVVCNIWKECSAFIFRGQGIQLADLILFIQPWKICKIWGYHQQCCWTVKSSGMWHSDVGQVVPQGSKKHSAFCFRLQKSTIAQTVPIPLPSAQRTGHWSSRWKRLRMLPSKSHFHGQWNHLTLEDKVITIFQNVMRWERERMEKGYVTYTQISSIRRNTFTKLLWVFLCISTAFKLPFTFTILTRSSVSITS